jgi:hypothetical protein
VTDRRLLGAASLALGMAIIAIAQLTARTASPPLYDGVIPTEPYRWLQPPPGQVGGAEGASATIPVLGGQSDLVAVATTEIPPQAQVFAAPGALTLPAGATMVEVSIQPIAPAAPPPAGYIDGNVYRISVTDQAGAPVTAPESEQVSVVLRSTDLAQANAVIERFDGTAWAPVDTSSSGGRALLAVVTAFGDFAIVAPGTSPYATSAAVPSEGLASPPTSTSPGPRTAPPATPTPAPSSGSGLSPTILLAGVVLAVVVLAIGAFRAPRPTKPAPQGRRRR